MKSTNGIILSSSAIQKLEHSIEDGRFSESCRINSFSIEELLATELRALYQRRKKVIFLIYSTPKTQLNVNAQPMVDN